MERIAISADDLIAHDVAFYPQPAAIAIAVAGDNQKALALARATVNVALEPGAQAEKLLAVNNKLQANALELFAHLRAEVEAGRISAAAATASMDGFLASWITGPCCAALQPGASM